MSLLDTLEHFADCETRSRSKFDVNRFDEEVEKNANPPLVPLKFDDKQFEMMELLEKVQNRIHWRDQCELLEEAEQQGADDIIQWARQEAFDFMSQIDDSQLEE